MPVWMCGVSQQYVLDVVKKEAVKVGASSGYQDLTDQNH